MKGVPANVRVAARPRPNCRARAAIASDRRGTHDLYVIPTAAIPLPFAGGACTLPRRVIDGECNQRHSRSWSGLRLCRLELLHPFSLNSVIP